MSVIAIDFDGTCVTHEYPYIGKDIGAVPVLKELIQNGHKLILWTMRSDRAINGDTKSPEIQDVTGMFLSDAIEWFDKNNILLWGIQTNPTQKYWTTSPKCHADLYIDDSGLGIPLINDNNRTYVNWKKVRDLLIKQNYI